MWIRLLISLFFVIQVHADLFTKKNTTADEEKLTKMMEEACPKTSEIYLLMKDLQSYGISTRSKLRQSFSPAQARILSVEMRDIMKIKSVGYWTNYTKPNDQEVEEASTIDQYYLLKERQNLSISYDQTSFSEKDMKFVVSALDKRFPRIRSTYKNHLNDIRQRQDAPVIIDRQEVDMMFEEMEYITKKFDFDFNRVQEKQYVCNSIKLYSVTFEPSKQSIDEIKELSSFFI